MGYLLCGAVLVALIIGAFCATLALSGDPFVAFLVALCIIVGGCYAAPLEVL